MLVERSPVGVFYTQHTNKGQLEALKTSFPQTKQHKLEFDTRNSDIDHLKQVEFAIVCTGDGGTQYVAGLIIENNLQISLLVVDGGSFNGTYQALRQAGKSIQTKDLTRSDQQLHNFLNLHPATIDEKTFFLSAMSPTNLFIRGLEIADQNRNGLTKKLSRYKIYILSLLEARQEFIAQKKPFDRLELYMINGSMGLFHLSDEQQLGSDQVTKLIAAESHGQDPILPLCLVAFFALFHIKIPKKLAVVAASAEFHMSNEVKLVNVDGTKIYLERNPDHDHRISRSVKSVQIAALTLRS